MSSAVKNPIPRLTWCAILATLVVGCANPGPPRSPSLRLPAQAKALNAERVASQVLLSWTTPDKTSDEGTLRGPITAVICREGPFNRIAVRSSACAPVAHLTVTPGESHAADTLPSALLADPPVLLAYKVELFNSRGRSAKASTPVFVAAGAAPPDPGPLRISSSRKGAIIEWSSGGTASQLPSGTTIELTRVLIADAQGPIVPAQPKDGARKSFQPASSQPSSKNPSAPAVLRASRSAAAADPGGLVDPGVLPHDTYTYTAQRIRTVFLNGHTLELKSALSPIATFTDRDIFPPQPPTGLESIASTPLSGPSSIDLSWDPNLEPDLLGYNVLRADAPSGAFHRLNPEPLAGPAYRDLTAIPGHPYRYRVTAVDRNHNESPPSAEVRETLQAP